MGFVRAFVYFLLAVFCLSVPELPAGERGMKTDSPESGASPVFFREVTSKAGIHFHHINGASPEKYFPETMGAGGLFFDFNKDGLVDIFLVDGGSMADEQLARRARSLLYRNKGDGTFTDVTAKSGIKTPGYGMGVCAADFDNDGWVDLYLTNFGPNVLYRNNGNGTFTDITETAGVGSPLWSSSCAFGDIDNDGDVDIFVGNFLDFSVSSNKKCYDNIQNIRSYCHPNAYNGLPNILYRNNSDGTFTDITRQAGVYTTEGKALGVVFGDYNNDGWIDIYVANDSVPNFLYQNQGDGVFKEVGLLAGVTISDEGKPEAGMGTDFGDFDNDGLLDIFVTNLDFQTNTLYRNLGQGIFSDVTFERGHGDSAQGYVGWGTAFFDFDNDGDSDIIVANGHVLDTARNIRENAKYAQRNLLYQNDGTGTYKEISLISGPGMALEKVSRGLAVGDIDNDGDLDILITNNGQTSDLLLNEGGSRRNSLLVRTIGTKSNRDGIGARLKLTVGSKTKLAEVKAGSSYLGQNDLRVHFGLGQASRIDRLEVRWPSGTVDVFENLEVNQILTLLEGKGIARREPFRTPTLVSKGEPGESDSTPQSSQAKNLPQGPE